MIAPLNVPAPPSGIEAVRGRVAEIRARFAMPGFSEVLEAAQAAGSSGAVSAVAGVPGPQASAATGGVALAGVNGAVTGDDIVALAKRHLGVPYVWGGTDPQRGLDCSGLVQVVYRDAGIDLPRVSRDQATVGQPVESLADARPGDLVAFGSPVDHIGIYAGNNTMVVAPRTGDVVKVQQITRTPTAIRRILP